MSANATTILSTATPTPVVNFEALVNDSRASLIANLPPNIGLAVIGTISAALSTVIIVTVYQNASMRSFFYTNMVYLAAADFLMAAVHACVGYKRLVLLAMGSHEVSTPARCTIDNEFIKFSQLASGTQTIAIAFDRLFGVSFPLWYHKMNTAYNHLFHASLWVVSAVLPAIQATGASTKPLIANCLYAQTIQDWASAMMNRTQLAILVATIVAYGLTIVAAFARMIIDRGGNEAIAANQIKRQRRITLVCFLVGITLIISQGIAFVWSNILLPLPVDVRNFLNPWPGAILQLSGIVNFFLYWFLDRDFRSGMKQMLGMAKSPSVGPSRDS